MELRDKIDELAALVESARAMPMSASCVVNRADVLQRLDQLRSMLPSELSDARDLLADREGVVAEGRQEAERIIEAAKAERSRMIARTEVVREASREAETLLANARTESERMRAEIDDYVDTKLANFEVVLHKTLQAVEKGRAKISGRHELDDLAETSSSFDDDLPLLDG